MDTMNNAEQFSKIHNVTARNIDTLQRCIRAFEKIKSEEVVTPLKGSVMDTLNQIGNDFRSINGNLQTALKQGDRITRIENQMKNMTVTQEKDLNRLETQWGHMMVTKEEKRNSNENSSELQSQIEELNHKLKAARKENDQLKIMLDANDDEKNEIIIALKEKHQEDIRIHKRDVKKLKATHDIELKRLKENMAMVKEWEEKVAEERILVTNLEKERDSLRVELNTHIGKENKMKNQLIDMAERHENMELREMDQLERLTKEKDRLREFIKNNIFKQREKYHNLQRMVEIKDGLILAVRAGLESGEKSPEAVIEILKHFKPYKRHRKHKDKSKKHNVSFTQNGNLKSSFFDAEMMNHHEDEHATKQELAQIEDRNKHLTGIVDRISDIKNIP